MTKKELKKLTRADLIEMLIAQSIEFNELKEKYEIAEQQLKSNQLAINSAGSIAEASLKLTDIFVEAEKSAKIYLDNIKMLSERQNTVCESREHESRAKTEAMVYETEQKCKAHEEESKRRCDEMVERAKRESQEHWDNVQKKLEEYYRNHNEIRELLGITNIRVEIGNNNE